MNKEDVINGFVKLLKNEVPEAQENKAKEVSMAVCSALESTVRKYKGAELYQNLSKGSITINDIGMDSLDIIDFVCEIEDDLNTGFDLADLVGSYNITDVLKKVYSIYDNHK